ncbi:MAG: Hsp20/alpha crystallin family protein [Leptolyngbyaceae cyanobacterium MO_188.B28]|nr:Hsp20/alpha crystallin family protein [Leptolyngbyaceae cyanobacterium MO_188.B28]
MALVRWRPFHEIEGLQREMNQLFDTLSPTRLNQVDLGGFAPAAEIHETDEAINLKLEVPGMKPEEIDIQVTADSVSISGERKSESRSEEDGVTRSEFHYGKFQRIIPLSTRVQNTQVKAEYKDGVLTLNLPKAEEEKNKVVKVKVG